MVAPTLPRPTQACSVPEKGCLNGARPDSIDDRGLFRRCSPAVVQVLEQDSRGDVVGSGSGFLASRGGLIVTNYHVVRGAHQAVVVLPDKTRLPVLGAASLDADADIAILKVAG